MYQDYKDLLSAFRSHGVKYLVVGGFAVIYHSQPRFTKDMDLFIKPDIENATATYKAHFMDRESFFRFGRDPKSFDILPAIPGVDFDAAWERRVETLADEKTGLRVNFISAEDLITAKLASGRPHDLADADAVKKAQQLRPAKKNTPDPNVPI
jgi:hypothetical protein